MSLLIKCDNEHTRSKDCRDLHSTAVGVFVDDTAIDIGVEIVSSLAQDTERPLRAVVSNSLPQVFIGFIRSHQFSTCLGLETGFL